MLPFVCLNGSLAVTYFNLCEGCTEGVPAGLEGRDLWGTCGNQQLNFDLFKVRERLIRWELASSWVGQSRKGVKEMTLSYPLLTQLGQLSENEDRTVQNLFW